MKITKIVRCQGANLTLGTQSLRKFGPKEPYQRTILGPSRAHFSPWILSLYIYWTVMALIKIAKLNPIQVLHVTHRDRSNIRVIRYRLNSNLISMMDQFTVERAKLTQRIGAARWHHVISGASLVRNDACRVSRVSCEQVQIPCRRACELVREYESGS